VVTRLYLPQRFDFSRHARPSERTPYVYRQQAM
jgi:hypothetical protein